MNILIERKVRIWGIEGYIIWCRQTVPDRLLDIALQVRFEKNGIPQVRELFLEQVTPDEIENVKGEEDLP